MRGINPLVASLGALTLLRLYTPRNLLLLWAFGLGYAMTNMILHPYKSPPDPLHPAWEKDIKILRSHKRYDEALKLVNQHIQADPNSYLGYSLRSYIFADVKNYSAAKKDSQLAQQKIDQLAEQARKNRAQLCNTNPASVGQVQDIYTQSRTTYICRLLNP